MKAKPKYKNGDMISYRISKHSKTTYYGVILSTWHNDKSDKVIYEVAAMNDGMCSYSIGESYIDKKIS